MVFVGYFIELSTKIMGKNNEIYRLGYFRVNKWRHGGKKFDIVDYYVKVKENVSENRTYIITFKPYDPTISDLKQFHYFMSGRRSDSVLDNVVTLDDMIMNGTFYIDFDKYWEIKSIKPYIPTVYPKKPIFSKTKSENVERNDGEYISWRNKVIERDKVCQCCGFPKHLEAHHIYSYRDNPSLRTELMNGITLCKFCHKKYHSAYGKNGANPRDLADFMKKYSVR